MQDTRLARIYRKAPRAEVERLFEFRRTHPLRRQVIAGVQWEYLLSGQGEEGLLILPGLLGIGEMAFEHILAFEDQYRVIAPSYPFSISRLEPLLDGIAVLLESEQVERAHVLGGSYGGMVAQAFVRRCPQRIASLVLSHTGGPEAERAVKNQKFAGFLRWMPMPLLRRLLRLSTRKALQDAPEQIPFWEAYSDELISRLSRDDLLGRYLVAIDFDATSAFTPGDLEGWPGRILILEGDNDPLADASARQLLKTLHPQARVHTFHGSGHVASIARVEEYTGVIRNFLQAEP